MYGSYEREICRRQHRLRRSEAAPAWSRAVVLALLITTVSWSGVASKGTTPDDSSVAALVLQRFITRQAEASGWPVETIEIEASLPTLKKTGRLLAIRRLLPVGRPDYKVLELSGDRTVKNQVIVRYLSADQKAAELAASSVALTPDNYKIRYVGRVWLGDRLTVAFRLIPRKKREGLINGALWLDSETGSAVRESGYLAKNPSVFVKRINVTRENELHNGTITQRITHVAVETRLIGLAQMIIVERPTAEETAVSSAAEGGR
jgi:hypothetical protein